MRRLDDAFESCLVGSIHEFAGFPKVVEWEREYLPPEEREKYDRSLGDEIDGRDGKDSNE